MAETTTPAPESIDSLRNGYEKAKKTAEEAIAKRDEIGKKLEAAIRDISKALGMDTSPKPAGIRKPAKVGGVTAWQADKNAKRVPNFVIAMTGIKTKDGIKSKYGEQIFKVGEPAPKPLKK